MRWRFWDTLFILYSSDTANNLYLSSIILRFCCLISINCLFLAFLRALFFIFQFILISITLSWAILQLCRILSACFLYLIFFNLRSSCLRSFNNFNRCSVLYAFSLCFWTFNSCCNNCSFRKRCLFLANFFLSFNLKW